MDIAIFDNFFERLKDFSLKEQERFAAKVKQYHDIHINVYKNPTPVVACMVPIEDLGFLLIKRPREGLAFPGGYIDENENAQKAASRELWEETRIHIPTSNWTVIDTKVVSQLNTLLIFVKSKPISRKEVDWNIQTSEAQYLKISQFDDKLCFNAHQEVLDDYTFVS